MQDFSKNLKELADYRCYLEKRLDQTTDPELINQSIEEIQITLEEMQIINQELVATRELLETERWRYQSWFDLAPNPYIVTTVDGTILDANQAAADLLDYLPARLKDKLLVSFVPLSQRAGFRRLMEQVQKNLGAVHEQKLLLQRQGSSRPGYVRVQARVLAVRDQVDQSLTLRWALHDISEQVTVERELRRAVQFSQSLQRLNTLTQKSLGVEQILRTLVEEVADVLGVGCDAGLYEQVDSGWIRHACFPPLSKSLGYRSYLEPDLDGYEQLRRGEAFQFCGLLSQSLSPELQDRVALFVCPIGDSDGIMGDLWLFMPQADHLDEVEIAYVQQATNQCAIAIRKIRLHQQIKVQLIELRKLDQLKDQFLSTISHELRTPVTIMRLAVETLKRYPDADRQQRYLNILQAECEREIDLVNDLLDLQQLEAGTYSPYLDTLDLHQWLTEIEEQWQEKFCRQQQSLQVESSAFGPISCDPISLGRIVKELLKNAYKYTPAQGRIVLSADVSAALSPEADVQPEAPSPSRAILRLTVSNTGHIDEAHLPNLFDKFYRVPNCDPWARGGTGLGLTLVKNLAEFLGGTITVISDDGWVRFTLVIPVSVSGSQ